MALPDLKYQSDLLDGEKEFFAAFLSYGVTGWLSASLDHSAPLMAQSTVTQSANVTRKVRGSHDFFLRHRPISDRSS